MSNLQFSKEEQIFVQQLRKQFESNYEGPKQLRHLFEQAVVNDFPDILHPRKELLWRNASKGHLAKLLAVQSVSRPSGNGQLSLYVGDVFALEADQWIVSSFQDDYSPSGGSWVSFWKYVEHHTNRNFHWDIRSAHLMPSGQIAALPFHPKSNSSKLPTIVLHGLGSRAHQEYSSNPLWVEKVYNDALFAIRKLRREKKVGQRLAMPILFSSLHDIEYSRALELQKDFAIDLIQREPHIREVMITTFDNSDSLLQAYHHLIDDGLQTTQEDISSWLKESIKQIGKEVRQSLLYIKDRELSNNILEVLSRMNADTIYINDIAVLARNTLERWTLSHNHLLTDKRHKLYNSINQLRSLSGTPSRNMYYIDGLREIGNVGAHQKVAPHPLEEADLITILLGLKSLLTIHKEIISTTSVK